MGKRSRTANQEPLPEKPTPANSSTVTVEGKEYTAVKEGLATVLFPKRALKKDKNGQEFEVNGEVFYNPIQQFNRDLSVLAIKTFAEIFLGEKQLKLERKKANVSAVHSGLLASGADTKARSHLTATSKAENSVARGGEVLASNVEKNRSKFTILDALSATGLRALRYVLELPMVTSATANDLDSAAVDAIRKNIEYNKQISVTSDPSTFTASDAVAKINPTLGNAQHHMYSVLSQSPRYNSSDGTHNDRPKFSKYEVIDIDPYGSAAPFLDAAVQAVADGGLLCVTCTDAGVWASTGYSEKCYSLYGGLPIKGEWSHEAGLRLILHSIATAAGKYGLYIEPLLSLSIDFYARVWVRVRNGPAQVKKLASSTMIVYNCDQGCGSWVQQRLGKVKENSDKSGKGTFLKFGLARAPTVGECCLECGSPMHLGGPMWAGPLHSAPFVQQFLSILPSVDNSTYSTIPRIAGMLQTASQEIPLEESPFFYTSCRLSKTVHCEAPPSAALRGALIGLGYQVARSHCKPNSIKTDAPHGVVWEVMRRWIEQRPRKEGALREGTPGFNIMQKAKDESLNIVFDKDLGKEADKVNGVVRYQVNPTANWGPMARAIGNHSTRLVEGTQTEALGNKKRVRPKTITEI
ncbi:N2,N2-dimethylguanosine tRNA methyltransferase-domain-containing protein [Trichophaea hybrida]|nr:N2,N2-dimethylguanosine tRNA methyltransferase-domain-containing protein [Trichophaea hybrida]